MRGVGLLIRGDAQSPLAKARSLRFYAVVVGIAATALGAWSIAVLLGLDTPRPDRAVLSGVLGILGALAGVGAAWVIWHAANERQDAQ